MKDRYESPLASRYASDDMLHLFSPDMRFETWRRLWVSLAKAQHALGLPVTQEQVDELAAHVSPIDYELVAAKEKELRHDVMAHIHAYGAACPKAMRLSNAKRSRLSLGSLPHRKYAHCASPSRQGLFSSMNWCIEATVWPGRR